MLKRVNPEAEKTKKIVYLEIFILTIKRLYVSETAEL